MKIEILIITIIAAVHCEECGKQKSAHALVYGGTTTKPGEWPWLIPLMNRKTDEFFCGSNLISHQHVLTGNYLTIDS